MKKGVLVMRLLWLVSELAFAVAVIGSGMAIALGATGLFVLAILIGPLFYKCPIDWQKTPGLR